LRGRQNPSTNFWENLGEGVMWVIDCLLDYNGAVTAIATVFIATFTATIWYVNRRQLKHAREVERAYLSGGGPNRYQDGARHFVLTHENTGKTPAIFKDYSVFLCDRSSLPAEPEYLDPRHTLLASHQIINPGRSPAGRYLMFPIRSHTAAFDIRISGAKGTHSALSSRSMRQTTIPSLAT